MDSKEVIHGTYGALLFDKRWRDKRARILSRDEYKCIVCGSTDELVVHHKQYHLTPEGQKYVPWDYEDKYLVTLCKDCHSQGHARYEIPTFTIKNK